MKLICSECDRDLNAIGQDNMSHTLTMILCEDCAGIPRRNEYHEEYNREDEE